MAAASASAVLLPGTPLEQKCTSGVVHCLAHVDRQNLHSQSAAYASSRKKIQEPDYTRREGNVPIARDEYIFDCKSQKMLTGVLVLHPIFFM